MSAITTLVNNFDLIMENRLLIMGYAPYRFSRITFPKMTSQKGHWLGNNYTSIFGSHLGSYLMIWENYQSRWPASDVIPLRGVGSPFSGYVNEFVGYSRNKQQVVREKPEGFTTGAMLRYVQRFRELFPEQQLAVPIEQVVKELKTRIQMQSRPSYQLLNLREDFCRLLAISSGIESGGPSRIKYNLLQDGQYKPVVRVEAVLEIDLSHEERRRTAFDGSAVYVADLVREGKARLRQLAETYGFRTHAREQQSNSLAQLVFDLWLPDYDAVLQNDTVQYVTHFMHEVNIKCNRF